jgi:hypothetical protein
MKDSTYIKEMREIFLRKIATPEVLKEEFIT